MSIILLGLRQVVVKDNSMNRAQYTCPICSDLLPVAYVNTMNLGKYDIMSYSDMCMDPKDGSMILVDPAGKLMAGSMISQDLVAKMQDWIYDPVWSHDKNVNPDLWSHGSHDIWKLNPFISSLAL